MPLTDETIKGLENGDREAFEEFQSIIAEFQTPKGSLHHLYKTCIYYNLLERYNYFLPNFLKKKNE